MTPKLFVYVWENFETDYGPGLAVVIASQLWEAKEKVSIAQGGRAVDLINWGGHPEVYSLDDYAKMPAFTRRGSA